MTRFTPRPLWQPLMLATALLLTGPAQAAVFKDPAMQQALESDQDDELLALARARLKTDATDPQGLAATALVGMQDADTAKLEAHALSLQQCVERHPRAAVCHFVLGQVLGTQAMAGGMMKAMTLTGRIKESFQKALALEPQSYEARDAQQQFYLMPRASPAARRARPAPWPTKCGRASRSRRSCCAPGCCTTTVTRPVPSARSGPSRRAATSR